tara:strand:- start:1115 stop:1981 length:867 start_codon:yes stop_codon:yes gene_type:complete
MTKIVLGTAQFSGKYGLNNKKKIKIDEIKKITNFAKLKKIKSIDTAPNYFNLYQIYPILNKFSICSKIPTISKIKIKDLEKFLNDLVDDILIKYKKKKLNSLIFHDTNDFRDKRRMKLALKFLIRLKKKRKIGEIGASIYTLRDFKSFMKLAKNIKIDLIQIPINLLDRSFLNKNFQNKIKKNKIKIQARSIFLQGLLLESKRHKFFKRWDKNFEIWDTQNISSKILFCYDFVKNQNFVDEIIIGFNSYDEIKFFFKSISIKPKMNYLKIIGEQKNKILINPSNWNLR